ncbi:hypothetical protein DHX103_11035 [Planococcus sp. X10-3]|uniref:hypothetical protein n=1 Tax=Planococcus sp. X10-3 TaxID=3061240 RepID=UPI003BB1AF2A
MLKYKYDNTMSRHHAANPNAYKSLHDYLRTKDVVDLRGNLEIINFENGYGEFKAIDKSKKFE